VAVGVGSIVDSMVVVAAFVDVDWEGGSVEGKSVGTAWQAVKKIASNNVKHVTRSENLRIE